MHKFYLSIFCFFLISLVYELFIPLTTDIIAKSPESNRWWFLGNIEYVPHIDVKGSPVRAIPDRYIFLDEAKINQGSKHGHVKVSPTITER